MYSFIISTYNRDEILTESLLSYASCLSPGFIFEILIIDNFGQSNTKFLVENFRTKSSLPLVYIYEENKGLSHARNSGIKNSKYEWIIFIDDDALVSHDYLITLNNILTQNDVFCLGGKYLPWYKFGKPKWYIDDWASSLNKPSLFSKLIDDQFADGGNLVVNKKLFLKYGLFNENLGMKGNKIGYGEEVEFQQRLKSDKINIWFAPDLLIYHLVPKYKLKVSWFIKSWYAHGINYWNTYNLIPRDYGLGFGVFLRISNLIVVNFLTNSKKLFSTNYYIQNWIIDSLKVPAWEYGRLISAKKNKIQCAELAV
jgi:glycosyltransferase involved in cell wall biosynthesis